MRTAAVVIYPEERAHEVALKRLARFISAKAAKLAPDDLDLRDDVVQEGLVAVWELDASRFADSDEGYFRASIVNRMREFVRRDLSETIQQIQ